jgi:hypothetical protein
VSVRSFDLWLRLRCRPTCVWRWCVSGACASVVAVHCSLTLCDCVCGTAGPLNAVVTAQGQAALTTVNFIRSVGFDPTNNSALTVSFNYQGMNDNGTMVDRRVTVPFLAMLPIPSLEVRPRSLASCV